jgi:hypothetical protein
VVNTLAISFRHAHHVPEIFSCSVCKETGFKEKENLKMHLYKTHGMGEFFRSLPFLNLYSLSVRGQLDKYFLNFLMISYIKQHMVDDSEKYVHFQICNGLKGLRLKPSLSVSLSFRSSVGLHACFCVMCVCLSVLSSFFPFSETFTRELSS